MRRVGQVAGLVVAWCGLGLLTLWLMGFGPPGLRLSDLPLPGLGPVAPSEPAPSAQAPDAPSPGATAPAPAPRFVRPNLSGPTGPLVVLDPGLVPFVNEAGRDGYRTWLAFNLPRVFVVAPGGTYGWAAGGGKSLDDLRTRALDRCAAGGTQGCAVYAEDLSVVWPGQQWTPLPPPGPLVAGPGYAFVPDERFIWHGPDRARGVYVWGHGFNGLNVDVRGLQPQSHVRPFNNAGFDVVRFDRDPRTDWDPNRAAGWLRDGLAQLRQQGYQFVIVGGQSRGAWNALQMLDTPGAADAVVAVAPGAHGQGPNSRVGIQLTDLRRIMDAMPPSRTRVALVQFADDGYSADPEWRAELFRLNELHVGAMLMIDRPAGFSGHGSGETYEFGQKFGACLLRFVLDEPSACPR